ncbi:hypothetical protein ACMD2_22868 [Ananas comosus]|uniref:Uncharacterized protein n=1 Tax=Ananas comosus TaxID=4615 RepID=A0A199VCL0_ANACO|nr:hypothetical protein ACMD2_22868 [Ananas comosus]
MWLEWNKLTTDMSKPCPRSVSEVSKERRIISASTTVGSARGKDEEEETIAMDSSRWKLVCFAMNASIVRRNSAASSALGTHSSSAAGAASFLLRIPRSVSDRRSSGDRRRRRSFPPILSDRLRRISTRTASLSSNSGAGAGAGAGTE